MAIARRRNLTDAEIANKVAANTTFQNPYDELDYFTENSPLLKQFVDDRHALVRKQEEIMSEQRQLLANLQQHRFVSYTKQYFHHPNEMLNFPFSSDQSNNEATDPSNNDANNFVKGTESHNG